MLNTRSIWRNVSMNENKDSTTTRTEFWNSIHEAKSRCWHGLNLLESFSKTLQKTPYALPLKNILTILNSAAFLNSKNWEAALIGGWQLKNGMIKHANGKATSINWDTFIQLSPFLLLPGDLPLLIRISKMLPSGEAKKSAKPSSRRSVKSSRKATSRTRKTVRS